MTFESKPVTLDEARRAVQEMLGRSKEIHATTLEEAVAEALAAVTPQNAQACFRHCGYGS